MKTLTLLLTLLALPCMAADYYYVEISTNGMTDVEVSSYGPVTNQLDALEDESGRVRVEVTKAEYEADKDVQPKDRLKAIPKLKILAAKAAAAAEQAGWGTTRKEVVEELRRINDEKAKAAADSITATSP